MLNRLKSIFIQISSILVVFLLSVSIFLQRRFIVFSDAAKFADVARTWLNIGLYGQSFTFWTTNLKYPFSVGGILPVMPFSIVVLFKIFGVNDFAVIATSFFYFLLTLVFVFLLAKKVFKKNLIVVLSTLAIGFNYDLINYATSGASETPFIFEIVTASYFVSIRKKWGTVAAFSILILMYFTRPQAFIYIAGIILFWLLINFKTKRAIIYFAVISGVGLLIDKFVLTPLSGKYFLYSIIGRGMYSTFAQGVSTNSSNTLRGMVVSQNFVSLLTIFKNTFYNLYNFFKLIPQIMSPYLWALFVISLFRWGKNKVANALKVSTIFMVVITFLVTALTIPFYRYLHPVVPLVYLFAVETLVWMVGKGVDEWEVFKINKQKAVVIISGILVFLFVVGQTLGVIFLDSRYKSKLVNKGKPPVYAQLSYILRNNTNPSDIVVTNLDSWGSWYGERKTVWYPLKPDMLIPPEGQKNPFDAIFLTSYLMDDENYYMGEEWRQIFENPKSPKDEFIAKNYKFAGEFKVPAEETYEKQEGRAILLVRN